MKILLVHGVGGAHKQEEYYKPWEQAVTRGLRAAGWGGTPAFTGFSYDDLFQKHYAGPGLYAKAIAEFLGSAVWHWVTDPITNLFRPSRAFPNPYGDSELRWTAGMVAQLAVHDDLREELRARLRDALKTGAFDLVAAHSLGSLVTYDFFRNDPQSADLLQGATYLTFGSQINNEFARNKLFPGRLKVPAQLRSWFHLFNEKDPVLTAPIRLSDERFRQVYAHSESGHSPVATAAGPGYLDHPSTQTQVWAALAAARVAPLAGRAFDAGDFTPAESDAAKVKSARVKGSHQPQRRALLIGINEYPNPAHRLEGCVNDVFLMSEILQERGFRPEDIRVIFDSRATAEAIRERLAWLLYRADDGMERVLFYSGHGAQIPAYNASEEIDHVDECLVPHDFDWNKPETALRDDDFFRLYSDLPAGARFFAVFDCCHSAGMTRAGAPRARAIDPPDDIRHRMLRWNKELDMWEERPLPSINPDFGGTAANQKLYMGANHATYRLGRAMRLRRVPQREYRKLAKNDGPFLPVIMQACGEGERAYEYRHGVTSYGAFTYAMGKLLRGNPAMSFSDLQKEAAKTLKILGYAQTPEILGPRSVLGMPVPGEHDTPARKPGAGASGGTPDKAAGKAAKKRKPGAARKPTPRRG